VACPALLRAEQTSSQGRTLVLLHLSGGNDGLNTIVPYADPLYAELRPRLNMAAQSLPIDERAAFHPALAGLARLFDRGQLAIVQGVGYPEPDYSHRGSCAVWAAGGREALGARQGGGADVGWWDRVVEPLATGASPPAVSVGPPVAALVSPRLVRTAGSARAARTGSLLDYAAGEIQRTLATVARVLTSACPPPLVLATVGGFDTHSDQLARHEQVLHELDNALCAFQAELAAARLADRVLTLAWSEFGRRPAENATGGTDHGTAGPVFLLGQCVRGGLYGQAPSLAATDFGNLVPIVHLQSIYRLLAAEWLRADARPPVL
jgi:uncharacterized protein (DUF1501 family)